MKQPQGKKTSAELQEEISQSPFERSLGLTLEESGIRPDTVVIRCPYGESVGRSAGSKQYHGGVIASLIDIAGDYALLKQLGYGVPTVNIRVDYLRAAENSDLWARAIVRKAGRSLGVVDVDVTDSTDRLIAVGRGCYSTKRVLPSR